MNRYSKNSIFTTDEMEILKKSSVCIIGCGGLGGHILEMIARLGIGSIKVVDGDNFDISNLNRQILSLESNIGKSKVNEAKLRVSELNSDVNLDIAHDFLDENNARELIKDADIVVDALDSISARKILADACLKEKKVMIHGAIAGWYGQISTIYPEDNTLERLYPSDRDRGVEKELGNPSFTPALVASIQVSEIVKVLIGKKDTLRNKVMYIDLLYNDFDIIEFK